MIIEKVKTMSNRTVRAGFIALVTLAAVNAAHAGLYFGAGGGAVRLDPNVADGITIEDEGRDFGAKAVLGKRFGRRASVELYYADLGAAQFNPAGEVGFESFGVNALWRINDYFPGSGKPQLFVSLGLGSMESSSVGVSTDRGDSTSATVGIGASFHLRHGLILRTSLETFDREASMASALLVKGFGRRHGSSDRGRYAPSSSEYQAKSHDTDSQDLPVIATPSSGVDVPQIQAKETSKSDITIETALVLDTASSVENLAQIESVYFNRDSAFLAQTSESSLKKLLEIMASYPEMRVEVQGHADAEEGGNTLALSELRAQRVSNYLWQHGIDPSRLSLVAYDASQPAADAGNRLNRRVQFRILVVE